MGKLEAVPEKVELLMLFLGVHSLYNFDYLNEVVFLEAKTKLSKIGIS